MRLKNGEEEEFLLSEEVKMRKVNGTMSDSQASMYGNPVLNASLPENLFSVDNRMG